MLMKINKIQIQYSFIIMPKGTIRASDTEEVLVLCVALKYIQIYPL